MFFTGLVTSLWLNTVPAQGTPPPGPGPAAPPILRLETGLHTAPIRALALSRDGRLALTAAEDKTARLWELPSGRLLRTFRPTVEEGNTGKLYACALSPDGTLAALGGWTQGTLEDGHRVLLLDTRTGALLHSVEIGDQVVNFLAFSPDGTRLAVHLGGHQGLRLLRVPDGTLLAADDDYAQPSYRGAFDPGGRYAATGDDGFIRLYDAGFHRLRKALAPGQAPFGLAFSPDGRLLALGHADRPEVEVLNASDLTVAYRPAPGSASLGLVAWSPDGETLYATGGEDFGANANPLRRWTARGRGPAGESPLAKATVSELLPLPGGDLVFAAQDPAWGVVNGQGQPRLLRALHPVDLRQAREAFRVTPDAAEITLPAPKVQGPPPGFSVPDLELRPAAGSKGVSLQGPGAQVAGWKDGPHPTWRGQSLPLEDYETSRCVAYLPKGSGFLLGTDWWLRSFDADGQERWKSHLPAPAWAVGLGAEGRVAVTLLADGSYRWQRTADGATLFSLFVAPDRRWVLWTPSGYFATSVGGEGLVGWQVNRPGQAADFFPVGHFRDRFYRPELMPLLLGTLDEAKALKQLAGGQAPAPAPAPADLPPVLTILAPPDGLQMIGTTLTVPLLLRTHAHGTAPALQAFHVAWDGQRWPAITQPAPDRVRELPDGEERTFTLSLDAPAGSRHLGLQAELADGRVSEWLEASLRAPQAPAPAPTPAPPTGPQAPTLRLLAVGVSAYADPKYNLSFSAKDARDVAEFFRGQEGRLFAKVDVKLLTDAQATGQAILHGLDALGAQARPGDVSLVFISSHGGTDENHKSFYLLPYDFGLGSWGVDGPDLKRRVEAIQGKVLMLLDTCHSGNVLGENRMRGLDESFRRIRFINELLQAGPGTQVFSSSTGSQVSLESPAWNNGAFTKALREGLGGAADPGRTGRVTTDMLDAWLRRRVAELTRGRQTPVAGRNETAQAFPVAVTP
jgi:hypothetical protein